MLERMFFVSLMAMFIVPFSAVAQKDDWLPVPTGPYKVGTTMYHWVDETRDEVFTDDLNDKRELVVRVWYPAEVGDDASPMPYLPNGEIDAPNFQNWLEMMRLSISVSAEELALRPTHSYRDQPVFPRQSDYPVLVFSHGAPGMPAYSTAQFEELVSNGYVVVAINHTHIAAWTIFPDGRLILSDRRATEKNLFVEVAAQDQSFVLDQLEWLNEPSADNLLSGWLDLDRVGSFGVSWGAWVTPLAVLQDKRFKAAIVQHSHSRTHNKVYQEGLDIPIMFMDALFDDSTVALRKMRGPAYRLEMPTLKGTGDFLFWPTVNDQVSTSSITLSDATRAAQIVNTYTRSFFDRYLKDQETPLLDGNSPDFPEVSLTLP